jgi:NAD+ kinase
MQAIPEYLGPMEKKPPIQRIGVLYNPLSPESEQFSVELVRHLEQRGLETWHGTSQKTHHDHSTLAQLDMLIALGGDGTVLRTARLAIPHNIPILTVAMGRLNFLAEMVPDDVYDGLDILLDGGGWLDHRALIHTTLRRQGLVTAEFAALNEVVMSRGDISRILTVNVKIDNIPLTTYRADGVLVSTATGSSAYALSAGGPIVDPRSRALVLVPVAAHLTAVPSMVLHEDSIVTLHINCCRHATLAVDGRENLQLHEEDQVEVKRSEQVCTFVRVHPPNEFYASLIRRLRRE